MRLVVMLMALVWAALMLHGFKVVPGRDMGTYEEYFSQILRIHPDNPLVMLFRTPGTPLFFGATYQVAGLVGVKLVLLLCSAGISLAVYEVASSISKKAGVCALFLHFLNLPFHKWYFAIDSETLQSILVAGWFLFAFQTL